MQFSEAWLRSLVNPDLSSAELCHVLTMAGLEVEEAVPAAPLFNDVVVAEILTAEKHPDADRLQVCSVRIGEGEPLQIVCGAPNARVGLKTACACVGAVLPGDFKIKKAKVRGVESSGMLCSTKELGIGAGIFETIDGIMELPSDAVPGTRLRDYLALDDRLITLKLTPNRGDCLSMQGLAREVAAITGAAVQSVDCAPVEPASQATFPVRIDAPDVCPIYCGRLIEGVNPKAKTPAWMLQRFARNGLRGISPLVDITNYVLLELGQPMHAFDLDRLQGKVTIRQAQASERLALLNDETVDLTEQTLVIADDSGPLAIAGIMGGSASSVSETTQSIFLEAAHFVPDVIAGRARSYGLSTDSSHRFERGVDPALPPIAIERATRLILEICGGVAGPVSVSGAMPACAPAFPFRPERARRVIGMPLSDEEMLGSFDRLGLHVDVQAGVWQVSPPSWRFDLGIEVDLVEEVARIKGYDSLAAIAPIGEAAMCVDTEATHSGDDLKEYLITKGYQEVVTYSFISSEQETRINPGSEPIRLLNPIASQMNVMRSSLWPGLLQTLQHNLNHGQERLRLFEVGRCFFGMAADAQPLKLSGLAYGACTPEQWGEATRHVDFFDIKGDLEGLFEPISMCFRKDSHPALHPGQSARLYRNDLPIGWVGSLHPRLTQELELARAPILFELDWQVVLECRVPRYQGISRLPAVRRDIAVQVAEELPVGVILEALMQNRPARVSEISLFDVYRGKGVEPGSKSLAFSMLLQHTEKTLTDSQIEESVAEVVKFLSGRFNAALRS